MKNRQKKGISLIVLIITIVVMIIIAASIILALNSANVIGKGSWAQISSDRANLQSEYATILAETIANKKTGDYLGITVEDVTSTDAYKKWAEKVETTNSRFSIYVPEDNTNPAGIKVVIELTEEEMESFGLIYNQTAKRVEGYDWVEKKIQLNLEVADGVMIPEGFTVSIFDKEDEVEEGLVIYKTDKDTLETYKNKQEDAQKAFDQFVWVPVENMASFERTGWASNTKVELEEVYNEPASYIQYKGEAYEYRQMRASVEEFGGFFIARYEAGAGNAATIKMTPSEEEYTVVSKKAVPVYNYVPWGATMSDIESTVPGYGKGAVYLAQTMYPENDNYTTHLIYGVQWDAALSWLKDTVDVTDGRAWGNYEDSTGDAAVGAGMANMTGTTGKNEAWKAKNIYDLAGNACEWTMEAYANSNRILRGCGSRPGSTAPPTLRGNRLPSADDLLFGFRPVLYITEGIDVQEDINIDIELATPEIPEGFTASIFDTEDEVEEGLVIYKTDEATLNTYKGKQEDAQKAFDQFVWVPVPYTKTNTDTNNNGTDDGFDSVFKTTAWDNNAPTTGLSSNYTEPSSYNGSAAYQYATEVKEYNEMRKSVEKYGGFFIARYEAGDGDAKEAARTIYTTGAHTVVSKKGAYVYNYVGWGKSMTDAYSEVSSSEGYGAVYLSKNMYPENSNYTTHLIYGVQWDATLNWLRDKYNVTDSKSWGNYENSTGDAAVNAGEANMNYTTGRNEAWKAKNIYDLAGNMWEWTMESSDSVHRVYRGGDYNHGGDYNVSGNSFPATDRTSYYPDITSDYSVFRPVLYLN